jgi:hypothetical protein
MVRSRTEATELLVYYPSLQECEHNSVVSCCAILQARWSQVRSPDDVIIIFFTSNFISHYGNGVESASTGIFLTLLLAIRITQIL